MSILTQGTHIYFIDPADQSLIQLTEAKSLTPGGAPSDQIEDTSLEDKARKYKKGLRTPGQASITVAADPANPAHVRLYELSKDDTDAVVKFAVGMSDGETPPTVTGGNFTLPTTRSWLTFDGYIADFPMDFTSNSTVTSNVSVQRSGDSNWTPKA